MQNETEQTAKTRPNRHRGLARIAVTRDDVVERKIVIGEVILTVGRALSNDLVLTHEKVSRHHAELHPGPDGVAIVDVGSSNGTYVAGQRLVTGVPHLLADGAAVQIGPFTLTYYAPPLAEPGR